MSDERKEVSRRRRQYSVDRCFVNPELRSSSQNRKKTDLLICSVCEAPAHGYNFDAITCESCKAFFRRNALKETNKLKCRSNTNQCEVNATTRKRCKACRLKKCFEKGMRADWILTDEERVNKKLKIEENRRLRRLLYPNSSDSDEDQTEMIDSHLSKTHLVSDRSKLLSDEDLMKIEEIQRAFRDSVRLTSMPAEIPRYPNKARLEQTWEMMNIPANLQASRLITYCKLLPEFASLNENDKILLVKYNTFATVFIRAALNYDRVTDTYHEPDTDDCVFEGKDLIKCFSYEQYEKSTRCVCRLVDGSINDSLILRILLIIILLSKGSFFCRFNDLSEPIAEDIHSIYRAQNRFVDLLWKYCQERYGWKKTVQIWINLVTASIEAHLQSFNTMHNFLKDEQVADHLVPLMKSVTLIT